MVVQLFCCFPLFLFAGDWFAVCLLELFRFGVASAGGFWIVLFVCFCCQFAFALFVVFVVCLVVD